MKSSPRGRVSFLVSNNIHKFDEIRHILNEYKVATVLLRKVDAVEIQDDDIKAIAITKAIDALKKCNLPIVVEDAGLFIESLKGFPGPYSSYIYKKIGNSGVISLLENSANRRAYFQSVAVFLSSEMDEPSHFIGQVKGEIVKRKRGDKGFGFDPIFKPQNSSKTFAEMSIDEKNRLSHRALAFHKFAKWYTSGF